MRSSAALYIRQLLARLHPPLPATPKESQRLLNVLETSFRKHLDEVHPPPNALPEALEGSHRNIPLSAVQISSKVTDSHLKNVLNHPMLRAQSENESNAEDIPDGATAVVCEFERLVAEGKMSVEQLLSCIKDYRSAKRLYTASSRELGPEVATWFYLASPKMKVQFLGRPEYIDTVVPAMVMDNQEAVVWDWLRVVYERAFDTGRTQTSKSLQDPRWLDVEDALVSQLMRSSIRRKELNDAIQQFVQASKYRQDSGRASTKTHAQTSDLPSRPLSRSWKRLAAAIITARQSNGIDATLFSQACSFGLSWADDAQLNDSIVSIYHPSTPSVTQLSRNLRDSRMAQLFLERQARASKVMEKAILLSVLDGAQLALAQNLRDDARFLLDFVRNAYPEVIPPAAAPSTRQQSLEISIRVARGGLQPRTSRSYLTAAG